MRSRIYLSHAICLLAIYSFHVFMAFEKGDFGNFWRIGQMVLWAAFFYVSCLNQLQRWEK